jgi:thymidylate synthase (FAD)
MELKYIKKVAKKEIYDYSPVKGFVELWDFSLSNLNQEAREETIATVASLSYGNEQAKNSKKLCQLLEELGHSSVKEFIRFPVDNTLFDISFSLRNDDFCTYEEFIENSKIGDLREFEINLNIDDLIKYHKQAIAVFKIKVPLFVRSQYHRHRCQSVLEISRRYVKPDKVDFEFWYPPNNDKPVNDDEYLFPYSVEKELDDHYNISVKFYEALLKTGYKPEVARSILPQSLYTTFWVMKDYECARNFYIERYSVHAQEQIKEVAKAELELLKKYQSEFLGQYVVVVGDEKLGLYKEGTYIKILDIQEHYKALQSNGWNKDAKIVYCEFDDDKYYAKFNLEKGLFVGKILKEKVGN